MGKSKDTTSKAIDPMALHRKLEPLYELLDKGNNKAALKGATQLLAKHPNLQIARALKGIALYRSGKKDEGVAICDEIKDEGPEDDNTLHTLQVFYRNAGMPSSIVSMFEAASARDPKNLEHLSLLFSAHARDFAFVKQQQCAMKLYRLTNDPKHVMWAVCGILLQTRGMTREERRDATLTRLAAGMCAKLEKNGGVTDRETLLVCARVLRECGRGRDARTLLESALAEKCVPMKAERLSLCATQAAEDGDVDDALAHWRGVLKEMPDDWQAASCAMDLTMRGTVAAAPRKAPASAGGDWAPDDAFTAEGVRGGGRRRRQRRRRETRRRDGADVAGRGGRRERRDARARARRRRGRGGRGDESRTRPVPSRGGVGVSKIAAEGVVVVDDDVAAAGGRVRG